MSMKSRLKRKVRHEGLPSTLHSRHLWTGKPTLTAAGAGGSIPAGKHYYAAVLSKSGTDYWGGGKDSVTCVDNDKVTVSDLTIPSGYTCKLYRNTDPSFPTPSLLSSDASFPYSDTVAMPGAGTPSNEVSQPYEYFTDTEIYTFQTSLVTQEQRITAGGQLIEAELKMIVAYNVTVAESDEITYNLVRYKIMFVDKPVARGAVQFQFLYVKRAIQT